MRNLSGLPLSGLLLVALAGCDATPAGIDDPTHPVPRAPVSASLGAPEAPTPSEMPAGTLVAWGRDHTGPFAALPEGDDFVAVAAGDAHSLALRQDGSITSWGSTNFHGLIEDTPTGTGFVAVAAGLRHSLALHEDGTITAWGHDLHGVVSDAPASGGFVAISATDQWPLNFALRSDGTIAAWGRDHRGSISDTPASGGFVAVSAGPGFGLALREDGTIVAWGNDFAGRVSQTPTDGGYVAISAGGNHSLALRADGTIVVWGRDSNGVVSDAPTESGFLAVSAGDIHNLALREDGTIVAWGRDFQGSISDAPDGDGFVAVSSGRNGHSLALHVATTTLTGMWTGTYSWDCGGSLIGSTDIAFDLADDGQGHLSGTATYLGGTSTVAGRRILDGTPDEHGQITGLPHPEGMFVFLAVEAAAGFFVYNEFDGAVSANLNAISGNTLNGDSNEGCSAAEHPSGAFSVERSEP